MNTDQSFPNVGDTLRGRIARVLEHGAIVQIKPGGLGYLHRSVVSWKNGRPLVTELLKVGDEIDVLVLKVSPSKKSKALRVELGFRQTQLNPWTNIEEFHAPGRRCPCEVVEFLPFGAMVEFPTGFRALVHDSEISWTERNPKARDFLRVGDRIDVVIQSVDIARRKIYASYRQATENPWTTFSQTYPKGSVTVGTVASVCQFGVFVMLPNGCSGLVHKNLFPSPAFTLPVGERVRVQVVDCD